MRFKKKQTKWQAKTACSIEGGRITWHPTTTSDMRVSIHEPDRVCFEHADRPFNVLKNGSPVTKNLKPCVGWTRSKRKVEYTITSEDLPVEGDGDNSDYATGFLRRLPAADVTAPKIIIKKSTANILFLIAGGFLLALLAFWLGKVLYDRSRSSEHW